MLCGFEDEAKRHRNFVAMNEMRENMHLWALPSYKYNFAVVILV